MGLVAIASLACLAGCEGKRHASKDLLPSQIQLARQVVITRIEQRDLSYAVETVGTLEAERMTSIASGVSGVVDEVLFEEGDLMDPSKTILVKIDVGKYKASADLAKANEERARARLVIAQDLANRARMLRDRQAIAQEEMITRTQELLVAKAELEVQSANRRLAEINLAKAQVRPPYKGQINDRRVAVGDYVKEETVIATIADLSSLRLRTFVPELAAPRIHAGDNLQFRLEAVPNKTFTARITYLSTVADPQTHMFECKAVIDKPEKDMKPGMFARVRLETERHHQASTAPEESVRATEKGFVLFVPRDMTTRDGRVTAVAEAREVRVGLRKPGFVEILEGVQPGEWVVTRGAEALENGTPIEIQQESTKSPSSATPTEAAPTVSGLGDEIRPSVEIPSAKASGGK